MLGQELGSGRAGQSGGHGLGVDEGAPADSGGEEPSRTCEPEGSGPGSGREGPSCLDHTGLGLGHPEELAAGSQKTTFLGGKARNGQGGAGCGKAVSLASEPRALLCTIEKIDLLCRAPVKTGMYGTCLTYSRCSINGSHYGRDDDD